MTASSKGSKHAAAITTACRMIVNSDEAPSLTELATAVAMSSFHFHRVFRQTTGVTPKAYADANRASRVRESLMRNSTVTEAIYEAGFNSSGRFYEKSTEMLGMSPKNFRHGGSGEILHFAVGECSLGSILVASSEKGVCCVLLGEDSDLLVVDLQHRFPHAVIIGADAGYEALVAKVVGLVEMPKLGLALPLDVRGTAFQHRVWQALREIPVGSTASYTEIAAKIGSPKSVRAVAGACAANPIAVAIPCHRVVRSDGNLSGYRWGIERKRAILVREAGDASE